MKNLEKQTATMLLAALALLACSCSKNEIVNPGNDNSPTYASGPNGLSYFVNARSLTLEQTIPVTFTCDSLAYSLSVSGYSSRLASIVISADSVSYRSSDLVFNTSQAIVLSMGCPPKHVALRFSGFTGTLSFALGGIAHPANSNRSSHTD